MAEPGTFRDRLHASNRAVQKLVAYQPDLHESFWQMHDAAMRPGAVDRKTKELIALALVVAMHCDVCITLHVRGCLRAGATREEVYEALNVAVMEGDGPTRVYAGWAVEALEEYLEGRPAPDAPAEPPPAHRH
jgi:AhpD family alkylhydroperoxidase